MSGSCQTAVAAQTTIAARQRTCAQAVWSDRRMSGANPFLGLPDQAFWRPAVAEAGIEGLKDIWAPKWRLPADCRIITFGSCFAQHVSNALVTHGFNWIDYEPGPRPMDEDLRARYNFGIFSARTGNIYTARQLLMWAQLAFDHTGEIAEPEFWEKDGRFWDSIRPAIEPRGFASLEEARANRAETIRCFRRAIVQSDLLIFTMGLTEGWENRETAQPYATCPGTTAGTFDADCHLFRNYGYTDTRESLDQALQLFRRRNPRLNILLTVSPVPITATASGKHVLVASTYTKSVLRAVAGELAQTSDFIDYFPAFELLATHPARGKFYKPNLREVEQAGVDFAVGRFLDLVDLSGEPNDPNWVKKARPDPEAGPSEMSALKCEDEILEMYARSTS